MRTLWFYADLALGTVQHALVRLGRRLLDYAEQVDPTPGFSGDEEEA